MLLTNKQIFILSIVVLLITVGGYYFFFSIIENKNKNISFLSQEIDTYAQNESVRTQSNKVAEEQKDKIEKIDLYLLHKNEVVPFIETVEGAGKKTGAVVKIGTVNVGSDSVLAIRLEARGSWNNINRFLSYLENLPYKISLSKVDLNRASSVSQFYANSEVGVNKIIAGAPVWNATVEMSVLILQ